MYILQDFDNISALKLVYSFIVGNTYRAILLYRISSWLFYHKFKLFSIIFWSLNIALHACDISPGSKIGKGFSMDHTVGIVIGSGVNAGNNLRVFQNVTCGTRNGVEYPKIGNNVTLFSGCFVGGGITIGDNVKVGANAVVLNNIPPNSTAVGVPAKISF
jgi:serine O-acetyltransferase